MKTDPAQTQTQPTPSGLKTVSVVARYLSISRLKLYRMMDDGTLPYVKLNKSRRISWDAVLRLIEANTVANGQ